MDRGVEGGGGEQGAVVFSHSQGTSIPYPLPPLPRRPTNQQLKDRIDVLEAIVAGKVGVCMYACVFVYLCVLCMCVCVCVRIRWCMFVV